MICQNNKQKFDEKNCNFETHKLSEHDVWLYVNYIYFLINKDRELYTGDEVSVWYDYNENTTSWMPYQYTSFLPDVRSGFTELTQQERGGQNLGEKF